MIYESHCNKIDSSPIIDHGFYKGYGGKQPAIYTSPVIQGLLNRHKMNVLGGVNWNHPVCQSVYKILIIWCGELFIQFCFSCIKLCKYIYYVLKVCKMQLLSVNSWLRNFFFELPVSVKRWWCIKSHSVIALVIFNPGVVNLISALESCVKHLSISRMVN